MIDEMLPKGVDSTTFYQQARGRPQLGMEKHTDGEEKNLRDLYEVVVKNEKEPFEEYNPDILDNTPFQFMDELDGWTSTIIRNKEGSRGTILQTKQLAKANTLIVDLSDKNQDSYFISRDPPKMAKAMRWSDMVMANWKETCDNDVTCIQDLKYVFQHHIMLNQQFEYRSETSTGQLLCAIEDLMKCKGMREIEPGEKDKVITFTRDGETGDFFLALLGTPHADRVNKMLADYWQELNGLEIRAFHANYQDTVSNKIWNLIIELGR